MLAPRICLLLALALIGLRADPSLSQCLYTPFTRSYSTLTGAVDGPVIGNPATTSLSRSYPQSNFNVGLSAGAEMDHA